MQFIFTFPDFQRYQSDKRLLIYDIPSKVNVAAFEKCLLCIHLAKSTFLISSAYTDNKGVEDSHCRNEGEGSRAVVSDKDGTCQRGKGRGKLIGQSDYLTAAFLEKARYVAGSFGVFIKADSDENIIGSDMHNTIVYIAFSQR